MQWMKNKVCKGSLEKNKDLLARRKLQNIMVEASGHEMEGVKTRHVFG